MGATYVGGMELVKAVSMSPDKFSPCSTHFYHSFKPSTHLWPHLKTPIQSRPHPTHSWPYLQHSCYQWAK